MQKYLSILNPILFLILISLLLFIPLYPKFPLVGVSGTFVSIRIEDIIIGIALSLWALYIILTKQLKVLLYDKLNQALLIFFGIGLLSLFSGIFITHSVEPHLGILHFLRRIEFMMLLPFAITAIRNRKQVIYSLLTLSLVLVIVCIYALGQQYLNWPVISTTNSEFSKGLILYLTPGARVNSTFAGHYDLAVFLAMSLIIMTAIFFAIRKMLRPAVVVLGALTSFVLVLTAARLSFFAAVAGVLAALILTGKKKYILVLVIVALAMVIYPSQLRERLLSTLTVNILQQGQRYDAVNEDQSRRSELNIPTLAVKPASEGAEKNEGAFASTSGDVASDIAPGEPVDTTQLGVYRSFEIRLNIEWPRAINAFIKNPFLGTGYSSVGIATDNDFLRSLAEVGTLGTFAFGLVFFEIVKRLRRIAKVNKGLLKYFAAGGLAMVLGFLVNALFIDVFEASKVASLFWLILGVCLAIENFKEHDNI